MFICNIPHAHDSSYPFYLGCTMLVYERRQVFTVHLVGIGKQNLCERDGGLLFCVKL